MPKSIGSYPPDEKNKIIQKGIEAANKARARKKELRNIAHRVFTYDINCNISKQLKGEGFDIELTYEELYALKLLQIALSPKSNSIEAFKIIRFLAGESKIKKMKVNSKNRGMKYGK